MVEEKVIELFAQQLGRQPDQITPDADLVEDLGIDSLDMVELIMAIEEEFDIKIEDEEAPKFKTIGQVVSFIEKMVQ